MTDKTIRLMSLGMLLAFAACARPTQVSSSVSASGWRQVWSDEFDGPSLSRIDSTKWIYDRGDGCAAGICGWGNQEKESYAEANVSLDGGGHLAIVARIAPAGLTCYYGPCRYTSGRIKTKGKMAAKPGRVEARIKLPAGQGLWPAFWMLGNTHPETPWPQSGELDIMENHGSNARSVSSAIHGPGYFGKTPFAKAFTLSASSFAEDYHTFAVEWDATRIRFFADDTMYQEVLRADVERAGPWVFDQSFYVLLNLAVGGLFDGDPASDSVLPATMLVDYVRVFERTM